LVGRKAEWLKLADTVEKVRSPRNQSFLSQLSAFAAKLSHCYCSMRFFAISANSARPSRRPTFSTVSAQSETAGPGRLLPVRFQVEIRE